MMGNGWDRDVTHPLPASIRPVAVPFARPEMQSAPVQDGRREEEVDRKRGGGRMSGGGVRPPFSLTGTKETAPCSQPRRSLPTRLRSSRSVDDSLPGRPAGPTLTGRPSVHFRIGSKEAAMACRDIAERRRRNLERFHQRTDERRAAGLCLKCGAVPPAPERTLCEPCLEKRRVADRARTARLRAEGKPRRDRQRTKQYERERSRRQHAERKAAGICTKCGRAPARPERTLCEPCAERHRDRACRIALSVGRVKTEAGGDPHRPDPLMEHQRDLQVAILAGLAES